MTTFIVKFRGHNWNNRSWGGRRARSWRLGSVDGLYSLGENKKQKIKY